MIKYNKKEVDKAIKANNKFNIHALLKGRR